MISFGEFLLTEGRVRGKAGETTYLGIMKKYGWHDTTEDDHPFTSTGAEIEHFFRHKDHPDHTIMIQSDEQTEHPKGYIGWQHNPNEDDDYIGLGETPGSLEKHLKKFHR